MCMELVIMFDHQNMILNFKEKKSVNISLLSGPDTRQYILFRHEYKTRQRSLKKKGEKKQPTIASAHVQCTRGGRSTEAGWREQTVFLGSTGLVCER